MSISDLESSNYQKIVEGVKARLQEEGREARNLIAYSLPLEDYKSFSSKNVSGKLNKQANIKEPKKLSSFTHCKQVKRQRSASAGRDPQTNLRARHWGFLFRNLGQAVDEIYQTCEDDESIIECKEAIMMLERYSNDFHKLIEWLKLKWEYENTLPPQRPNSLTWEIRTSSPAKVLRTSYKSASINDAKRTLTFDDPKMKNLNLTAPIPLCENEGKSMDLDCNLTNLVRNKQRNSTFMAHEERLSHSLSGKIDEETGSDSNSSEKRLSKGKQKYKNKNKNVDSKPTPKEVSSSNGSQKPLSKHHPKETSSNQQHPKETSTNQQYPKEASTNQQYPKEVSTNQQYPKETSTNQQYFKEGSAIKTKSVNASKDSLVTTSICKTKDPMSNNVRQQEEQLPLNKDTKSSDGVVTRKDIKSSNDLTSKSSENIVIHSETKENSEVLQVKNTHVKPAPLVNMNKASQVRKAFNQSRAPTKAPCSSVWKAASSTENKSSTPKHLPRTLVRSSTTLEGSQNINRHLRKTSERSFCLDSEKSPSSCSLASSSNTSVSLQSWADKVRGGAVSDHQDSTSSLSLQDDDEGWEVVKRGRRSYGGSSASLNSQTTFNSSKSCDKALIKKTKPKNDLNHGSKARHHQPGSAVSMPSLHSNKDNNEVPRRSDSSQWTKKNTIVPTHIVPCSSSKKKVADLKKNAAKSKENNSELNSSDSSKSIPSTDAPRNTNNSVKQKSLSPHSDKCRKDATNLSKKNEIRQLSPKRKSEKESSPIPLWNNSVCDLSNDDKDASVEKTYKPDQKDSKSNFSNSICAENVESDSNRKLDEENQMEKDESLDSFQAFEKSSFVYDIEKEEEEKMRNNAAALASAEDEEKRLKQQIAEAERDTFEECEVLEEEETEEASAKTVVHEEEFYQYNTKYSKLNSLSWADEMDVIEPMDAGRLPGRVLHIHEKLSSPSRKLPISEKFRRHKEKLAKAQELRGKLLQAKSEKLKDLFKKIGEVNDDKERLLVEKRYLFDRKMERAEKIRKSHLQEIVNKAHDEENKAKEIAFINGLEFQNKLHDIMQQHQSHESRLADRAEERCRKQEEKAAKEVAAQERRKALEAERLARMAELCEKRRRRCERIDRQQAERREELLEQAREKARDREERITALQQAQLAKESELVKKIQQKQEETARRHEENIEQIRQRALESSIMKFSRGCDDAPQLLRYETKKLCTLCNSLIASDVYLLSHLRGKQHREALKELHKRDMTLEESESYNIKFIIDAPPDIDDPQKIMDKERKKALKKRCRKIHSRMVVHAEAFLKSFKPPTCKETPSKQKIKRNLGQILKLLNNQGSGPWAVADVSLLDRCLLELHRILENSSQERVAFASLGGFGRLSPILGLITTDDSNSKCSVLPPKSLSFCSRVLVAACRNSMDNCRFLIFSNFTADLVDYIMRNFNQMNEDIFSDTQVLPSDAAAAGLMELLAEILKVVTDAANEMDEPLNQRLQDVVSYCVSMGVTDKISWYFNHIQSPIDNDPPSAQIILAAMSLLSVLAGTVTSKSKSSDPTKLIVTFEVMEACGVVSLMYGSLLHQGGRTTSPPPESLLSPSSLAISEAATTFLLKLAELDQGMFQMVLGSEGISLEFRHICSFLLWYCSKWPCEQLLHNVISLVGHFTANHKDNQMVVQSGETPSVLQQLCSLPWQYFSEPRLTSVLFPTLLACCLHNEDNMVILQQEMSYQVLEDFLQSDEASDHLLMQIFRKKWRAKK